MNDYLLKISWPAARLGEALEALARSLELSTDPAGMPPPPERLAEDEDALGRFVEAAARSMNLDARSFFCAYDELERMLMTSGPALLRLRAGTEARFLALVGHRRGTIYVLDPQLKERRLRASIVCAALRGELATPLEPQLNLLLERIGVRGRKRLRAREAILRERLSAATVGGGWLLHISPGASFTRQLRRSGVLRDGVSLAGAHALQYVVWLLAWWVIGLGALQGRLDYGWLAAWGLLLLTLIPLRLFTTWTQGRLAIKAGGLLKQRLLYGALRLEPEETRCEGTGQFLGRIIETEAVESLALSGGLMGLLAGIELSIAAWVLAQGSVGWPHSLLLAAWVAATLLLCRRYFRKRGRWMKMRVNLTNDLVERMIGHRTRLAQEPRGAWHKAEDQALELYHLASEKMDGTSVLLPSLVPRGWLLVGIAALGPAFVYGNSSTARLAVALGGVLLAYSALRRMTVGVTQLIDAAIAWRQVAPVFHAAVVSNASSTEVAAHDVDARPAREGEAIMDARDLVFRYRDRSEPAIKEGSLCIRAGDKILLEGPSGSGKSTLAALLVGLREVDSGLLLLRGFDRQTLGDENWRRLVVAAPQFHENYVMAETFAFNLLMGRRWPARPEEMEEAEAVCRDLGLGELLDRMPGGMLQMVGETGWQLSHGEKSRLYIARTILQHADLVVLDESFAALDPENLRRALSCVLARTRTLVVIAHP
ncbi:MAG TPA: ABC transporter ATP-binding protein [Pyrinomonadaceae bacterium]|nr:ABC transporter ATP-binding protein [Pyrinomonadaceae bacterium]